MNNRITELLGSIAERHLGVDIADGESEMYDAIDVALVPGVLHEAYEAGVRAGVARELTVEAVVYSASADRFPWQVFCSEERCVLLSRNLKDHVLIASAFTPERDGPKEVPVESVPLEVYDIVRRELYGGRR